MKISYSGPLHGEITVPGDKSISHRSIMLGALSRGDTFVTHFLRSADCLSTISCFRKMGISIDENAEKDTVTVHGKGLRGLKAPSSVLDAGNSGTTVRLMSGILAGQNFTVEIDGDASIRRRPMKRILTPLNMMGADITSREGSGCTPLLFHPHGDIPLTAINYQSPVASAQVKSCVLLAGLYADGITSVTEPVLSRDHTERMLRGFGATLVSEGNTCHVTPDPLLEGCCVDVPGDISSAAYFIAAALLTPDSEIIVRNVGTNPTRDGFLRVCRDMGGKIEILRDETVCGEPVQDLLVRSSSLHGTTVCGEIIPSLIDELPIIAVMAAFAEGTTMIRDASELRVKESDRIEVMTENLRRVGVTCQAYPDGMDITGGSTICPTVIDSHLDHRIAMSFAVAAAASGKELSIEGAECVRISYPEFYQDLASLCR